MSSRGWYIFQNSQTASCGVRGAEDYESLGNRDLIGVYESFSSEVDNREVQGTLDISTNANEVSVVIVRPHVLGQRLKQPVPPVVPVCDWYSHVVYCL